MIEEQIKKITNLSFQAKNTKDEQEKDSLDNEVKDIIVGLKKQAIDSFKDESDIKRFLDNIINFNNYSFNNLCLIWLQNSDAKYVASSRAFSKMGFKVKEDQKYHAIKILRPSFLNFVKIKIDDDKYDYKPLYMLNEEERKKYHDNEDDTITFYKQKLTHFSTGYVYDASQTDMPLDIIEEKLNPILEDPRADGLTDIFVKSIYKDGFKVKYESIKTGAKGYCDFDNRTLVIQQGLNNLMRLKVLVHEYAHALAHQHLKNNNKEYKEHREQYETEAESVAYVVSKHLGLDTGEYSQMYLYSWSKNRDFKEIDDSFNTIVEYSKKIIKNFDEVYQKELNSLDKEMGSVAI